MCPKKLLKEAFIKTVENNFAKNRTKNKHYTLQKQTGHDKLFVSPFPDLGTLTAGLNSAFHDQESDEQVEVLARDPNLFSGKRSPSEIVTVSLKDGSLKRLFCKYGGYDWHSYGLWGVAYEVEVYRQVLSTLETTTAKFYGAYTAEAPNKIWLILEYLEDCNQLKNAPQPSTMIESVRWLARFHADTEELFSKETVPFLKYYDVDYYREWTNRTLEFAASKGCRFSWLPSLCRRWEELMEALLLPPTSIIHGDFYGSNILMRGDVPFVVDWESAGAAVGEIDLAFHTEGWPEEIVKLCEVEYQKTRWPETPPSEFYRRLQVGRLYQQFRWLGDHSEWTSTKGFQQLTELAVGLEVI
jgi:aminoglycoside phosphotransferase (APT) family kinase protein